MKNPHQRLACDDSSLLPGLKGKCLTAWLTKDATLDIAR